MSFPWAMDKDIGGSVSMRSTPLAMGEDVSAWDTWAFRAIIIHALNATERFSPIVLIEETQHKHTSFNRKLEQL